MTAASSSNGTSTPQEEASYICDACGEEMVIRLILPKAQASLTWKTVRFAAEPIRFTFTLMTMEMLRFGLNRNRTTSTFFRTKRNARCQSHDSQLLHP